MTTVINNLMEGNNDEEPFSIDYQQMDV